MPKKKNLKLPPDDLEQCPKKIGDPQNCSPGTGKQAPDVHAEGQFPKASNEKQLDLARRFRSAVAGCEGILDALPGKALLLEAIMHEQLEQFKSGDGSAGGIFDFQGNRNIAAFVRAMVAEPDSHSLPITSWRLRPSFLLRLASSVVKGCREEIRKQEVGASNQKETTGPAIPGIPVEALSNFTRMVARQAMPLIDRLEGFEQRADEDFNALAESCQSLVRSIAKRCRRGNQQLDELVWQGNLGLMRGIERYDPKFGDKLGTYAFTYIEEAINNYQRNLGHAVKYPPGLLALRRKIYRLEEAATNQGRPPLSVSELARRLRTPEEKIEGALSIHHALSMDQAIGSEGGVTLGDVIPDEHASAEEHDLTEERDPSEEDEKWRPALQELTRWLGARRRGKRRIWQLFTSGTEQWPGQVRLRVGRTIRGREAEARAIAGLKKNGRIKIIQSQDNKAFAKSQAAATYLKSP